MQGIVYVVLSCQTVREFAFLCRVRHHDACVLQLPCSQVRRSQASEELYQSEVSLLPAVISTRLKHWHFWRWDNTYGVLGRLLLRLPWHWRLLSGKGSLLSCRVCCLLLLLLLWGCRRLDGFRGLVAENLQSSSGLYASLQRGV